MSSDASAAPVSSAPAAAMSAAAASASAPAAAASGSTSDASIVPQTTTTDETSGDKKQKGKKRKTADVLRSAISIALICQSNLNRSMEAHWVLQEKGNMRAYSFGAGSKVRLPGESIDRPHVYEFGTPYDTIYKDLERKNRARYTKNGMLQMLDRDRQLKDAPERWQDHYERYQNDSHHKKRQPASGVETDDSTPKPSHFDIVITFENRVFEIVQADIEARAANPALSRNMPTHLINIDTTDNHAEAAVSANLTLELVEAIYKYAKTTDDDEGDDDNDDNDADADAADEDWVDKIDEIIDEFEQKHSKEVRHTVLFY